MLCIVSARHQRQPRVLSKCMAEVLVFSGASILHIYEWTAKVHFSVECIKLIISAFESLAFHNLSACDGRFPQLTLRMMVGGLQMTNNKLERDIDEVLGENDKMEEIEELKTDNQKLKEQNQKLRSRVNKRPNFTG